MAQALSNDLRKQVLETDATGASARSIAARFSIGISTEIRWLRWERESGEQTLHRPVKPLGSRQDAHEAFIASMIEEQKGITLNEMIASLKSECTVKIGRSILSPYQPHCRRHGLLDREKDPLFAHTGHRVNDSAALACLRKKRESSHTCRHKEQPARATLRA